ncbi:hypothetical protein Tco_0859066 [Tanacetum coccineum]|uniref:Uncharacterized protein n=1 Tax=Tanacetum coccineum TaxID=301880 RepID=A0ABQ5BGK7_9ASTR
MMKETSYELLKDDQKKQLGKNNQAKMTPRKEYERVFMCKTAKKVWHTLIITQQGNSQVKDCKIDLLTQQYESSQSQVKKPLIAASLDSMLLAKVTTIKEAKDLATLPFDELIGNLKVYEIILASDGVASKPIKEKIVPIALKANVTRVQTSSNNLCQDESDEDEEINLMAKNFRKIFRKGVKKHESLTYAKKRPRVVRAQDVNAVAIIVVTRITSLVIIQSLKGTRHLSEDLGATTKMGANLKMMQHVLWPSTLKRYGMRMESLNVTFDESLPKSRISPLVDDDMIEEHAVQNHDRTQNPNCDLEKVFHRVENIQVIKDHPIYQVIGKLDERTLRSHAQDRINFFAFVSTMEPKNIKEAIKDES